MKKLFVILALLCALAVNGYSVAQKKKKKKAAPTPPHQVERVSPCEEPRATIDRPVAIDSRGCVYKLDDGPEWIYPFRSISTRPADNDTIEFGVTLWIDFLNDWKRDMEANKVGYVFIIDGKECRIKGRYGRCEDKTIWLRWIIGYS